jgi:photoactive yellow protein
MEVIKYENYDLNTIVERIPEKIRDDLPFGLVKLDLNGTILEYNMAEAELTGFRPEEVIGRNFFLDVATCTQTPEFYGKFREGVDKGLVNVQFDYMFDTNMVPTTVRVRMAQLGNFVWMTVRRLNNTGQVVDIARAPEYAPQVLPSQFLPQDQMMAQPVAPAPSLPWMAPQHNVVNPLYAQQAAATLRGTPMPQMPPQQPIQQPMQQWAPQPQHMPQPPMQPQQTQQQLVPQPQQAQPAAPRRVGADGLEQFDFNG